MFTPHAWQFFGFGKAGLLYSHCNHYNLLYSNQNLLYSKYNLLYSPCNLLHSKNKSFLSQNIFLWSSPFRSIPKYNSAFKPFLGQPKSVLEAFKPFRRQPKPVLEAFKPFRGHPRNGLKAELYLGIEWNGELQRNVFWDRKEWYFKCNHFFVVTGLLTSFSE